MRQHAAWGGQQWGVFKTRENGLLGREEILGSGCNKLRATAQGSLLKRLENRQAGRSVGRQQLLIGGLPATGYLATAPLPRAWYRQVQWTTSALGATYILLLGIILCPSLNHVTWGWGQLTIGSKLRSAACPWETVFLWSVSMKFPISGEKN